MTSFKIQSAGIYSSKVAQPSVRISENRKTDRFEIELPIEAGGISYIDKESAAITPTLLIVAKPNQTRHTKFPFKCFYLHISVYDEKLYALLSSLPTFHLTADRGAYQEILDALARYAISSSEIDDLMMESLVLRLIYLLCTESKISPEDGGTRNGQTVRKAVEYIKKNLSSDLRLETVAAYVSVSPVYFHTCFKSAMGRTLHEYIEEERLNESISLMLSTDMTLAEIAYRCGFSSQSYFNYAFKRKMHTTPRKYIRAQNERYASELKKPVK